MHLGQPSSPSPGLRSQVPHQKICHPSPWRCDKGIAQRLSLAAAVLAAFLYRSRCWSIGRTKPGALPTSLRSHPLPKLQPSLLGFPLAWPTRHYMVTHQPFPLPLLPSGFFPNPIRGLCAISQVKVMENWHLQPIKHHSGKPRPQCKSPQMQQLLVRSDFHSSSGKKLWNLGRNSAGVVKKSSGDTGW